MATHKAWADELIIDMELNLQINSACCGHPALALLHDPELPLQNTTMKVRKLCSARPGRNSDCYMAGRSLERKWVTNKRHATVHPAWELNACGTRNNS